jgi:hypothetical protein
MVLPVWMRIMPGPAPRPAPITTRSWRIRTRNVNRDGPPALVVAGDRSRRGQKIWPRVLRLYHDVSQCDT